MVETEGFLDKIAAINRILLFVGAVSDRYALIFTVSKRLQFAVEDCFVPRDLIFRIVDNFHEFV